MKVIDAAKLQQMIIGAFKYLEENKTVVDELNVFPVPDGDTGTNMTMTMKSGVDKVNQSGLSNVEEVSKALSQGTLMGARGNSGVILSQLVRGMSKTLKNKSEIKLEDIRDIFIAANKQAYRAVMQPTEGTILTVARKMAEKAESDYEEGLDIDDYLITIVAEGQKALDNTPNQLPVLKEAGVVDSGGQGLLFLLRGALNALNGEIERDVDLSSNDVANKEGMFLLKFELATKESSYEKLKESIGNLSEEFNSDFKDDLMVAELKTEHPHQILSVLLVDGVILKVELENLNPNIEISVNEEKPAKKYGFIAVSRGEGYDEILKSMNIDRIISGGQTMNPSTEDIYKNIEEINAENIIIFPNNKNIIMSSKQACELTDKNAFVVETRSIPESFTAMLEFDDSESPKTNIENMNEVIADMHIVEVSISIRDTSVNNIEIKKDDYIGILDGKIVASTSEIEQTARLAVAKSCESDDISLITVYYGEDVDRKRAKDFVKKLSKEYKDVDVELVYGGQPIYYYQITLEWCS